MQELQIRFEPPDVYGVPASTEAIELEDTHRSIDKNVASLPVPTLPSDSALVTLPDRPLSLNALCKLTVATIIMYICTSSTHLEILVQ